MRIMKEKNSITSVVLAVFIAAMLLGHAVTFNEVRVFGVVVTLHRLMTLFSLVCFSYIIVSRRNETGVSKQQKMIMALFSLWIIIGLTLLMINPLSSIHNGLLELLNIGIGGVFVYTLIFLIREEGDFSVLFITVKIIGILFLSFAVFEITTKYHLPISRLRIGSRYIVATGIFYNENDFSTVLALITPFYLVGMKKNLIAGITGVSLTVLSFWVIYINDAWIVLGSLLLGLIARQWIIGRKKIIMGFVMTSALFAVVYRFITGKGLSVIDAQLTSMREGSGSLYHRLLTYKNALIIVKDSRLIGVGPDGFGSYMVHMGIEGLKNPHNLWLEIISQYGIVILGLYLFLILRNFVGLLDIYKKTANEIYLTPLTIYIIFMGVSISSSNFLESVYQWLPLAVGYAMENWYRNSNTNSERISVYDRYREIL